ncbi:MAG TPA: hypothetical protein VNF71_12770, partial [Acidimicrobiales bacterium]|nr:hypothetical protein [Acidimicrobiales bacterium]
MTATVEDVAGPPAPTSTASRRRAIWLMAGLAAAVLAAVTIGIVVTAGGSSAGAQQLTSTQHACQQWTGTYAPSLGGAPAGGWCTAMTDWMRQQLRGGHMTGAMM